MAMLCEFSASVHLSCEKATGLSLEEPFPSGSPSSTRSFRCRRQCREMQALLGTEDLHQQTCMVYSIHRSLSASGILNFTCADEHSNFDASIQKAPSCCTPQRRRQLVKRLSEFAFR
eukprot:symbB.v1.2.001958.t1/scaffold84.1/size341116/4